CSRRSRHTSLSRDWSSDVCSSDLRSAALPALSSRPDCTREYALIIHWMSEVDASISRVSEGIATFRTVLSSSTVSCARQMTPRISQRWGCPWTVPGAACSASRAGASPRGSLEDDVVMFYTVEQDLDAVQGSRAGGRSEGRAGGRSKGRSGGRAGGRSEGRF